MVTENTPDRFHHERQLSESEPRLIAGVDEAGRGPLAGPVVAVALMFPPSWFRVGLPEALDGLNDSKKLTARIRERFFEFLEQEKDIRMGISVISAQEIDRLNILRATHQAMAEALGQLNPRPEQVLVDGLRVASLPFPQTALVKGDSLSFSIAAASVVAKVTRDRMMEEYDRQYPQYGFAKHKGYGTSAHREALRAHGPCPIHRMSFAPLRDDQLDLFERETE